MSIQINDQKVLDGIRAISSEAEEPFGLWLFGETTGEVWFDDLILSTVHPDELDYEIARSARSSRETQQSTAAWHVLRKKIADSRRVLEKPLPLEELKSPARTFGNNGWKVSVNTGTRIVESKIKKMEGDREPSIRTYVPEYDENNNPIPPKITITADAAMAPGVRLDQIRWQVAEMIGWPDKTGEIIAEGTFEAGIVQHFTLPAKWTRRATMVKIWTE